MKYVYFLQLIFSTITYLHVNAIYQGQYYPITESPYLAALNVKKSDGTYSTCGGSIISEYWIVSAAHCVVYDNETATIQIRLGTSVARNGGNVYNVSEIIVNNGYFMEEPKLAFDVALIKVEKEIEFNEFQYPIPLTRESPKPGDIISVSGYGNSHYRVFDETLKKAKFPVIDDETCRKNYTIKNTQFCASIKEADLCFGDSGGPAERDNKLIGIVSQGCEYDAPVVFMKVSEFYDWIVNITGITYH